MQWASTADMRTTEANTDGRATATPDSRSTTGGNAGPSNSRTALLTYAASTTTMQASPASDETTHCAAKTEVREQPCESAFFIVPFFLSSE